MAAWSGQFDVVPPPLTSEEKREFMGSLTGVSLASDAFFPFRCVPDSLDPRASGLPPPRLFPRPCPAVRSPRGALIATCDRSDSLDVASKRGVSYVVAAGGSVADAEVIGAADEYNMAYLGIIPWLNYGSYRAHLWVIPCCR